MNKILLTVAMIAALSACSRQAPPAESTSSQSIIRATSGEHYPLVRDYDPEYGIVCYRVRYGEGLSCVKVGEPKPNSGSTAFSAVNPPANTAEY